MQLVLLGVFVSFLPSILMVAWLVWQAHSREASGLDLVDRIQHLVPSPDGDDALVWVCEPGEGFRVIISLCDEAAYGGLKTYDHIRQVRRESRAGFKSQICYTSGSNLTLGTLA